MLAKKDNSMLLLNQFKTFSINFAQNQTFKNQARENRKTLKWPKTLTKSNFINLKLKRHEEYLNYRTYYIKQRT